MPGKVGYVGEQARRKQPCQDRCIERTIRKMEETRMDFAKRIKELETGLKTRKQK